MKAMSVLWLVFLVFTSSAYGDNSRMFSGKKLLADIDILEDIFKSYHPGLYRYQSEADFDARIKTLREQLKDGASLKETYLAITRLAASVQCSHTQTNPFNQHHSVQRATALAADKLPLIFEQVEGRYWVSMNASSNDLIQHGDELLAINGQPIGALLEQMQAFIAADGSNHAKRRQRLYLDGYNKPQWFDILLPLLNPPINNKYQLTLKPQGKGAARVQEVQSVAAKVRHKRIIEDYPEFALPQEKRWQYHMLAPKVAYLRLHSFATFSFDLDWQAFIDNAFAEFAQQQANALVIDIRGNGGGMYEVVEYLYSYIADTPFKVSTYAEHTVYDAVNDKHRPFLGTWNPAVYDIRETVEPMKGGGYRLKPAGERSFTPRDEAFSGSVYLLIDGGNSSATFMMAREAREAGILTLAGEPNGGNLKGMNGGQMFFLNLPNTGIEVDVPLIAYFPSAPKPDSGLSPDIKLKQSLSHWRQGRDGVLVDLLSHIQQQNLSVAP